MIDPESRRFMDWLRKRYRNDEAFITDVSEAIWTLDDFFNRPKDEIITKLFAKLEKGAEEHGPPRYTPSQIKKNLEEEYLDVLGWYAVGLWQEKRQKNRQPQGSTK